MTGRIFRSIVTVAAVILCCSLIIIMGVLYGYANGVQAAQLKDELSLAAAVTEQSGLDFLERLESKRFRLTWIQPDGTVSGTKQTPGEKLRIDAVRRGEVPGIHTVSYDSEADCISITHDAHNRKGFALGAVLAAEFTATHSGLLTMDDLFDF